MRMQKLPFRLIGGGMGIYISNWKLARVIAQRGGLGTVSLTGIWVILARILQDGDPGKVMRRVLAEYPNQELVGRVLAKYFQPGGRKKGEPYRYPPKVSLPLNDELAELMVLASFAEVTLARQGHRGYVGANLLEKLQPTLLPCLFGAMMAGVDYILMGAGVPNQIPRVLDQLATLQTTSYSVDVIGGVSYAQTIDPTLYLGGEEPKLKKPGFLPIVSSNTLAEMMVHKVGGIAGLIVECPRTAGGHNAPPRRRQPEYGPLDDFDLEAAKALGVPLFKAGGQGYVGAVKQAVEEGWDGIQVGSCFALARESGIKPSLRRRLEDQARAGKLLVVQDAEVSPSGYRFMVVKLPGTLGDLEVRAAQTRRCTVGALASPVWYQGEIVMRCAAEPEKRYRSLGGDPDKLAGKACLCEGLCSTTRYGQAEVLPLITLGTSKLDILGSLPRRFRAGLVFDLLYKGWPRPKHRF